MFHGCCANASRGVSSVLTNSLSDLARSVCARIADHTNPFAGSLREIEEPFDERHRQRVIHVATDVDLAIRIPHRRVFRRDVWRVADDRVVLPPEDRIQLQILVQIAEEARVPRWIGEVVPKLPGRRLAVAEEGQQRDRPVAGQR